MYEQRNVNYFVKGSKRISRKEFFNGRKRYYKRKLKYGFDGPSHLIPKGTVLYLGTAESTEKFPHHFIYGGMGNFENPLNIIYTSTHEMSAEGYARCLGGSKGWVKKYVVKKDFYLADITAEQEHYEANEFEKEGFCKGINRGYYLKWAGSQNVEEIVICQPEGVLEFVGAKRCVGGGLFSEYYKL